MSNIYISAPLHRAWKATTKQWAREMRRAISVEVSADHPPHGRVSAPRPSEAEPPPEQFADVLSATAPFMTRGTINAHTFSAIMAASGAIIGSPSSVSSPIQYMAGVRDTGSALLSWNREWVGMPMVCMENFPYLSAFDTHNIPETIAPYPDYARNRVVLSTYDHTVLLPELTTTSQVPDNADIHPREQERAIGGLPASYLRTFHSQFRYTGCIRPAMDEEIDSLFDRVIRIECWLRSSLNLRDMLSMAGVDPHAIDHSTIEGDRISRGSPSEQSTPSTPTSTDVPAPPVAARSTSRISSSRSIPLPGIRPRRGGRPVHTEVAAMSEEFVAESSSTPAPSGGQEGLASGPVPHRSYNRILSWDIGEIPQTQPATPPRSPLPSDEV